MKWTWSRFSYLCRRVRADCRPGDSVGECFEYFGSRNAINLYTQGQPSSSLARELENRLSRITDPEAAQYAASLYSHINFQRFYASDLQYKRATLYLLYIAVVFTAVTAIYSIYVLPTMSSLFELIEQEMSEGFFLMANYGWVLSLFVVAVLLLSLIIGFKLKRAFNLSSGFSRSFIIRLFAFPSIKRAHARIVEALRYPVESISPAPPFGDKPVDSLVSRHLDDIGRSNMCVATEMEAIVEREFSVLSKSCEKQIRYITIFVGILIAYLLSQFLVTAYIPIFYSGEAI